jgi:hypothetical protein
MEREKFLFENFPFFREKTKLQSRWEIYNLINHMLVRRWTMPHSFTAPTRKSWPNPVVIKPTNVESDVTPPVSGAHQTSAADADGERSHIDRPWE